MHKRRLSNAWWSHFALMLATYIIAADILPNVLLVLVDSIGYLPYSDRPGPGWQMAHFPNLQELDFYASFALLLLKGTTFYALMFSVSGMILSLCSLPRWGLRVLVAPAAFVASGLMMAAGGWIIAISPVGIYTAAACGALWGLFVFPELIASTNLRLPAAIRIALPILLFVGGTFWLIKPLLPNPRLTNARIEVVRQDNAGTDLSKIDLSFVGPSIARKADSSGKYVSVNRMEFTTDGRNQLRVLLIIDDDHPVAHTFLLPRSGDAIYRQRQRQWNEERIEARKSEISLQLTSDSRGGISLQTKGPCCFSMSQSFGPYR